MNCDRCESLLSAFVDGDLSREDAAAVEAHVSGCDGCRESLEAWRALETALVARRDAVPPAGPFLAGVAGVFAPVRERVSALHRARVVMDAIFGLPGLVTFFSVVLGVVAWIHRGTVAGWLARGLDAHASTGGLTAWFDGLLSTYAADMTQVVVVYGVATALIIVTGAWMTMRYLHDH